MNIKEIEGERYIKFNNVLIVIVTAVVCLVIGIFIFIYVLYNWSEEIHTDPLNYGAKVYDISSCSCFDSKGVDFNFNKTSVWKTSKTGFESPNYTLDYSNLFKNIIVNGTS